MAPKSKRSLDPRPQEFFDRFHQRTRTRQPGLAYECVRLTMVPLVLGVNRLTVTGAENVPASGPVILAPNHFSAMDHFYLAAYLRRKVHFMAKSELFVPVLSELFRSGGTFPVRRGLRDEDAFITAHSILHRGGCVAMYCEGTRSSGGKLAKRAKPGIGRLALESGAAVVPASIQGSSRVGQWKRLRPPKVRVRFGRPMWFAKIEKPDRDHQQRAADKVFSAIRELYQK